MVFIPLHSRAQTSLEAGTASFFSCRTHKKSVLHYEDRCDRMNTMNKPQDVSYHRRFERVGHQKTTKKDVDVEDIEEEKSGSVWWKEDMGWVHEYVYVIGWKRKVHVKLGVIPICLLQLS